MQINWGCLEWQSSESFDTIEDAQKFWDNLMENKESMGLYPMDYATWYDRDFNLIDSWSQE